MKSDIDYGSRLDVFKKGYIDLQEGMKLRVTKNDQNLINSETVIINDINKNNITLKLENHSKITIDTQKLKHIEYGYCSTIHSSQGKTTDKLIATIASHKKLNNHKAWLVTISRHTQSLSIYMDNKAEIQKQIMTNKGSVKSALDLMYKQRI